MVQLFSSITDSPWLIFLYFHEKTPNYELLNSLRL